MAKGKKKKSNKIVTLAEKMELEEQKENSIKENEDKKEQLNELNELIENGNGELYLDKIEEVDLDELLGAMSLIISARTKVDIKLKQAQDILEYTNDKRNDLYHTIELLDLSDEELLQYSTELREVSRLRREVKDEEARLMHLRNFFETPAVAETLNYMGNQIGVIRKNIKKEQSREYKMRTENRIIFKEWENEEEIEKENSIEK